MAENVSPCFAVKETALPLLKVGSGKVRDIYAVGDDKLLLVVTDRISAFDVVFPNPIPDKGKVLNQISSFWFRHFEGQYAHHLITDNVDEMGLPDEVMKHRESIIGRSMLVKRTQPFMIECVVRGYLAGSGWKDYGRTGSVCGHALAKGLRQCEQLPEPIFTPATKAQEGHDENIDFETAANLVGRQQAEKLRDLTLSIYQAGAEFAKERGILIADTKFEFGLLDGEIILIDEVLTPDSSRFWPQNIYQAGQDQPSYDKQIVRNYLEEHGWNKQPPAPELPIEVIEKTAEAYRDVYRRLTGENLS